MAFIFKVTFIIVGLLFISGCSSVQSKKITDDSFVLTQYFAQPPTNLDSRALNSKAWKVCPTGFNVLTKNAFKADEFASHHGQCVANKACDFVLEWQLVCTIRAREKFSIFGHD